MENTSLLDELSAVLEKHKTKHHYASGGPSGEGGGRYGFWDPWGELRDMRAIVEQKDQQILTLTAQYKAEVELCTNLQAQVNMLMIQLKECQTKHT